jgi:hypothetical protein
MWLNAVLYVALAWVIICGLITIPFFGRLAYIAIRNRWRRGTGSPLKENGPRELAR